MNAALLMMSSAWMAGADVTPPYGAVVPVNHAAVAGCDGGCGGGCDAAPCDSGCKKAGLLDRLKAKFGGHKSKGCGCDAAPACDSCAAPPPPPPPAPVCTTACAPAPTCDTCDTGCGTKKAGLFDKLKARFAGMGHKHKGGDCDATCDAGCSSPAGCALPAAPGVPAAPIVPGEPPREMPKPAPAIPAPKTTSIVVPAPITPVSAPRLTGTTNPF